MKNNEISNEEYEQFQHTLQECCGIVLGKNKRYLVMSRLNAVIREINIDSVSALLNQLKSDVALRIKVVDAMTTNETYWFRDQHPFIILKKEIFPSLEKRGITKARLWSAACSSGQEPYTLSMMASEYLSGYNKLKKIEVMATDISPSVLNKARQGCYDEMEISRGLEEDQKKRYFDVRDGMWNIKNELKQRIRFTELNLMKTYSPLGKFHVVFCRNVLIYFSTSLKKDIISRIADTLEPDGYLFLGGSESMASYSDRFETVRYQGGLVYQLKR